METSHYKRTWDMMLEFLQSPGGSWASLSSPAAWPGGLESEVCSGDSFPVVFRGGWWQICQSLQSWLITSRMFSAQVLYLSHVIMKEWIKWRLSYQQSTKMEPGGPWGSVTQTRLLCLDGIKPFEYYCPNKGIQNIWQKLKMLIRALTTK